MKKLLGSLIFLTVLVSPAIARELGSGLTVFDKSPLLTNMVTTLSSIRVAGAKYYLTIKLGENVGEPLEKLTLQQSNGSEIVSYYLEQTVAFEGTPVNRGRSLSISETKQNLDNNKISIILDPPINPGTTFTVEFKPKRNPEKPGVYRFTISAYPAGEKPQGLYIGMGRLRFYHHGYRFP
ncbi:MAG TPA: hypothetical protein DCF68_21930 [Cyanothece sp. UBA12306]|nr:hypothetical protein [Cyanothece sp. UBA12306]